jgi:hypothetical protein
VRSVCQLKEGDSPTNRPTTSNPTRPPITNTDPPAVLTNRRITRQEGFELVPGVHLNAVSAANPAWPPSCFDPRQRPLDLLPPNQPSKFHLVGPTNPTDQPNRPTNRPITPQGTPVFTAPYVFMRDEAYWPQPQEFMPERFLPVSGRAQQRRHAINSSRLCACLHACMSSPGLVGLEEVIRLDGRSFSPLTDRRELHTPTGGLGVRAHHRGGVDPFRGRRPEVHRLAVRAERERDRA